jgi:hypothetical protein
MVFSEGTPFPPPDAITEIMLKVALNNIIPVLILTVFVPRLLTVYIAP